MKKNSSEEIIKNLEERIRRYQTTYYNGEAEISDAEFDLLYDELRSLAPDHPIFKTVGRDSVDGFPKEKHLIPMGSQEKAANPEEFRAWAKKISPFSYIVQFKMDGASLELQYEKGILLKAITRGDGIIGDDITPNALKMIGVRKEIAKSFSGGIRGEVIMKKSIWKEKYNEKANCRNAANGIMRRKDGEGCEDLEYISFDASFTGNDTFFQDERQKISWLKEQGFIIAETKEFTEVEAIIRYREEISNKRKSLDIEIDGLVIKDFHTDMTDLRRVKPERQIAFKFELEIAYSILREVLWSESGITYTPIGVVDPVRLAGTTVQRANLNNPDMIRSMGLKIGLNVAIVKRGEIIPKIEGLAPAGMINANEICDIVFPDKCSACSTTLIDGGTRLYCPNPSCPKKLHHRLEKWVSVLDIRELGEKLLKTLFDSGRVKRIPDLYTLTEEELAGYERMGELSAGKVIRNIRKKRELSLSAFIAGFDFEGVGELIIEKAVIEGHDTLSKLRSLNTQELSKVHGLGEITAEIIVSGLKESRGEMDDVLATGIISIMDPGSIDDLPLKTLSFCFTGELKSMKRNKAEEKVKMLGGQVKSSVVKGLTYLVTNDPESGSGKNKKAREIGVKIIDEEGFLTLIG